MESEMRLQFLSHGHVSSVVATEANQKRKRQKMLPKSFIDWFRREFKNLNGGMELTDEEIKRIVHTRNIENHPNEVFGPGTNDVPAGDGSQSPIIVSSDNWYIFSKTGMSTDEIVDTVFNNKKAAADLKGVHVDKSLLKRVIDVMRKSRIFSETWLASELGKNGIFLTHEQLHQIIYILLAMGIIVEARIPVLPWKDLT